MRTHAKLLAAALIVGGVDAHSSLISPLPRNSVDNSIAPWNDTNWGPGLLPGNASCPHPAHDGTCWGCTCVNGTEPCAVAQTCVYFNQGCSIGCKECDGKEANPNYKDRCGSGMNATNNDPYYRTMNRNVTALSKEDKYRWNPWRAPGAAPVFDACGMAGGSPTWVPTQLSYINTPNAQQGDYGSKVLPKTPTGIVWNVGSQVETKWSIRANHGGGYQYRVCALGEALAEECFQRTPVPFGHHMQLEWGNGTRLTIEGRYLRSPGMGEGPAFSEWAMNPLPYANTKTPPEFEPPCAETVDHRVSGTGLCSGQFPWDVAIVDTLVVPNVTAGDYVLQLRWDCEETAQIWTHCADITIVGGGGGVNSGK